MDVIRPDEREAVQSLRRLVGREGFDGIPLRDGQGRFAALVYTRCWSTRHVDVVIVEGAQDAQAYRASGIVHARPEDLSPVSLVWSVHSGVVEGETTNQPIEVVGDVALWRRFKRSPTNSQARNGRTPAK
jgi:hypothetical protein